MAKKCKSVMQSVDWCMGKPELPGIRKRVYAIAKSEILKWPKLPRDENGRATSAVYDGSFVLEADAKFIFVDIIPNRSQHTSDPQGDAPSQTQLNKLNLVHPAVGEEASALSAYLNNNDILWVFQDANGKWRCVGHPTWDTKTTVAQDNGQGATGQTGTTIAVEASDEVVSPFYVGTLVTEDGEIDCSGKEDE